jgi:malate dehydrogenase (oxaloacetate-decarboxylating)
LAGAPEPHARVITESMKVAAAEAIAAVVDDDELNPAYVIPSVFNAEVAPAVAEAVRDAAEQ